MRKRSFYDLRVVEMTLSVFRTLFSGGCSSGYLERNPMHIVRITYRKKFLCYAVSEELFTQTGYDLLEAGYDAWLEGAVRVASKPTCVRVGGTVQVIKSSVCGGATVDLEDRIEGIYQIDSAMGSYRNRIYLVPPCFFSMLLVPALHRKGAHEPVQKIQLAPAKPQRVPNQLEELKRALSEIGSSLPPEGKDVLDRIGSSCENLSDALALVDEAREQVIREIESYGEYRRTQEADSLPWLSTTPKVFGITTYQSDGKRRFFAIRSAKE